MKLLVTAKNGQVGGAITRLAQEAGIETIALGHAELDIADADAVNRIVTELHPTHIINAAAYNNVDAAEEEDSAAFACNALGPQHLALSAKKVGATLVHYSTDYVFDGTKRTPYTEQDQPNPLSAYGRSKLAGEENVRAALDEHYILRTAWVFTPGGNNFITRLIERAKREHNFRFIDDCWGTPTDASDVARATLKLIERAAPFGLYHAVGAEAFTPLDWARTVLERAGVDATVEPIHADELDLRAPRPKHSVLTNTKLDALGIAIPSGRERLDAFFTLTAKERT